MAKVLPDATIAGGLTYAAGSDTICVCSQQPTSEADAYTTHMLARVTVTPGDGNGSFTIADGDSSGRKVTAAANNAVSVTNSGDANHIAWVNHSGGTLRLITTCTTKTLTSGDTVDIPAHKWEAADPT